MTTGSLMKVESIAECSLWSILQYLWPALSDNRSWKPIFGIFESGRFTQVLLYVTSQCIQNFLEAFFMFLQNKNEVFSGQQERKLIICVWMG